MRLLCRISFIFKIELGVYLNYQGTTCSFLSQAASPPQLILPSNSIVWITYFLSLICVTDMIVAFALHFDYNSFRPYIKTWHAEQCGNGRKVTWCTMLVLLFICPD